VPYHWSNLYRPGEQDWYFCVTESFRESLPDGDFDVSLVTEEVPSTMKVLEFVLPGESSESVLINAHNCHPWQANDDISGCAVGISVMQELRTRPSRRFTYRLLIAPELIGTVHWLGKREESQEQIVGAILLKAVGNSDPVRLQQSFSGDTQLDKAAHIAMSQEFEQFESGPFRTIYGNDETVFDSPGFEIPSITFTRMPKIPFKGYHTDADTPFRISEEALDQTKKLVLSTIDGLEANLTLKFAHKGLVSLSHPSYNLYMAPAVLGLADLTQGTTEQRWHLFMNCLPRELNGEKTALDLAYKYRLPAREVSSYLNSFKQSGLAEEVEIES